LDVTTYLEAFNRTLEINPHGATRDGYGNKPDYSFTTGSCQTFDTVFVPDGGYGDYDSGFQNQAVDKAYVNFVNSYQKAVQTVQGGQFIGELRETIHFIKSPAKSLATLTRHYLGNMRDINKRYKRIAKDSAFLSAATGSFLSWQFGAKPLMNDIADGKKALDQLSSDTYHRKGQRFIGSGEVHHVTADGFRAPGHFALSGGLSFGTSTWYPVKRTYLNSAIIRGGLYPRTGTNLADFPLDSLGLGIENWVPTVYEICPFSWMADYFTNLGDVIAAASFGFVNLSWSNMTQQQTIESHCGHMRSFNRPDSGGSDPPPSDGYAYSLGGAVVDKHKRTSRGPMPQGHYFPDIRFKLPGLGQSLNFTAVINELTSKKGLIR
jgi:hypothetical protein